MFTNPMYLQLDDGALNDEDNEDVRVEEWESLTSMGS
jgi:hypothetical protein